MGKIKVTLSANAGVCIEVAGKKIWVDAVFSDVGSTFSALNPELREWVFSSESFTPPDYICYTHRHGDHYSEELTRTALEKWPDAKLIMPESPFVQEDGDLQISLFSLPHAGEQYTDVALCGIMISTPEGNILLPGDCEVASPVLAQQIGQKKIDLAILDFPWITLRKGQQFVEQFIRPSHIFAYHLPFAEDDRNGYRASAERAAKSMQNRNVILLQNPKQTEEINV